MSSLAEAKEFEQRRPSRSGSWIGADAAEFLVYLSEKAGFSDEAIVHVLCKPWHWQDEFDRWLETGDHRTTEAIREEAAEAAAERKWEADNDR